MIVYLTLVQPDNLPSYALSFPVCIFMNINNHHRNFIFKTVDRPTDGLFFRKRETKFHKDPKFHYALWARTTKNTDWSTGPLARPFARSLVRSHCSLVRLLRTAGFARALRCAHSFARSLIPSLVGKWFIRWLFCLCFFLPFSTIVKGCFLGRICYEKCSRGPVCRAISLAFARQTSPE